MSPSDIKRTRLRLHLTQAEFARILGVDRRTITRWETSKSSPHQVFIEKMREM